MSRGHADSGLWSLGVRLRRRGVGGLRHGTERIHALGATGVAEKGVLLKQLFIHCVYICIYLYIYIFTYVHVYIYIHMYTCIRRKEVCIYKYIYVHRYAYTYKHTLATLGTEVGLYSLRLSGS